MHAGSRFVRSGGAPGAISAGAGLASLGLHRTADVRHRPVDRRNDHRRASDPKRMSAPPHRSPGSPRIVIIGAGPTGLAAGYRLQELGHEDFVILEANDYVGGLATSFTDDKGFTYDIGGHVMFSH